MNILLDEIAKLVHGKVIANEKVLISCLSSIDDILPGSLVYADGNKNLKLAEASPAAAILLAQNVESQVKPVIQVEHPFKAFLQLLQFFYPPKASPPGIHPSAVIAPDVQLGKEVSIGPYTVVEAGSSIGDHAVIEGQVNIGQNVKIGPYTHIYPQVTIYDDCQIGERVCIHASTVIGSDGFGYARFEGKQVKIPHVGIVIIEDEVEIGANVAIDRATLGATVIGRGTKIDNLVQIAHSVKLGQHNVICAFTGIAGSTKSGDYVTFAANVGVSDHVLIDDDVILAARAGVPPKKHLLKGGIYLGNPARPKDKAIAQELVMTRFPFIKKRVEALEKKVDDLSRLLAAEIQES